MPSRAHLFYSTKKVLDKELESFVTNTCRRQSLLQSVGGLADRSDHEYGCCDVCGAGTVSTRLNILINKVNKRKAKRVRRAVSPNLEAKLITAREQVLEEHPSFRMVGVNFLCPDASIKKLCKEAEFATNPQHFSVEIRSELRDIFFGALSSSSSS